MKRFDPSQQLDLLRQKGEKLASAIYLDEALYLQELRNSLLEAVKRAIFLLITNGDQNRLNKLTEKERDSFHKKVSQLVATCSSFLTVEQLMELSSQMDRERQLKRDQSRRELLAAMSADRGERKEAPGSISISIDPPVENTEHFSKLLSSIDLGSPVDEITETNALEEENFEESYEEEEEQMIENYSDELTSESTSPSKDKKTGFEVIRSLFVIAGETFSNGIATSSDKFKSSSEDDFLDDKEPSEGLLPQNPEDLSRWLNSIDLAINRRLRNLSHALNVELLRTGIVDNLLPISLLDAAQIGHVDSLDAGSNLLRMNVPIHYPMIEKEMDFMCLLLRPSDLEYDLPRLRKCRSNIKRHETLLMSMVKQQRHWQARFLSEQAHHQWWAEFSGNNNNKNNLKD